MFTRTYTLPTKDGRRFIDYGGEEDPFDMEVQSVAAVHADYGDGGKPFVIDGMLAPGSTTIALKVRRQWWLFGAPRVIAADFGWGMTPV